MRRSASHVSQAPHPQLAQLAVAVLASLALCQPALSQVVAAASALLAARQTTVPEVASFVRLASPQLSSNK